MTYRDVDPLRIQQHDPWLAPRSPALRQLAADVFRQLESLRPVPWGRRPRADAVERRRLAVENLVANLAAVCLLDPPKDRLAVGLGKQATTRYDRQELQSKAIPWAVGAMEGADLITRWPGSRGNSVTTLEPGARFRAALSRHGVRSIREITLIAGACSVILKAPANDDYHAPKQLLDYRDTADTRRMQDELDALGAFINAADVTIGDSPQLPVQLNRQFQIASPHAAHTFDQHGRIYGGWWITMAREQRYFIRIAGEACADLDYVAMLTHLAYATVGAGLPEGDPYAGLEGIGRPTPSQREAIKRGVNSLYFRTGPMARLPDEVKAELGPEWSAKRFMAAVEGRHPRIAHLFGSGIGLRLLYTESCIMTRVLLDLMEQDVPALPIHDGCMVRLHDAGLARDAMCSASRELLGVTLPVKVSPLSHPPHPVRLKWPHMVATP